ncbi:LysR family transcriptional regulator OS=Streptomyces fumanus OX=67302 GN=GCM10018772_09840 PE=4 SV=1 [Streptomyces fumanus]
MSAVEARLAELGLTLPEVFSSLPLAAYQPAVRSGAYVYTSGQLPMVEGKLPVTGKVGGEVTAEEAGEGTGPDLRAERPGRRESPSPVTSTASRARRRSSASWPAADFTGQPGVINGASELLGEVLGDKGVHARSAVGVAVLPLDAPVEVEVQVELSGE